MNTGELKIIIDDFVQVQTAIKDKLKTIGRIQSIHEQSEQIASRIVAAKIVNGDYKSRDFYHNENVEAEYKKEI